MKAQSERGRIQGARTWAQVCAHAMEQNQKGFNQLFMRPRARRQTKAAATVDIESRRREKAKEIVKKNL